MNAMKNPDQEWLDKIHEKGVLLFGSSYNKLETEKRIRMWKKDNPEITVRGVYSTIRWWYDICGHTTEGSNNGFGIVPHVYEDAKNYFKEQRDLHVKYYQPDTINKVLSPEVDVIEIKAPETKVKNYLKGFELS